MIKKIRKTLRWLFHAPVEFVSCMYRSAHFIFTTDDPEAEKTFKAWWQTGYAFFTGRMEEFQLFGELKDL